MEKRSGAGLLHSGTNTLESKRQIVELEGMLQKEKADFEVRPSVFLVKFSNLMLQKFCVLEAVPYA